MFLISWNVAGWSSTASAIRASQDGSLRVFLDKTQADIICIQESKGARSKLTDFPVEMGASDPSSSREMSNSSSYSSHAVNGASKSSSASGLQGWESFWCFSSKAHRGFNGVVTFVRRGLTWMCDARPFDDTDPQETELNDEGRAVVTYHSAFTVVNVYVPNARGGTRLEFKMRFLRALKRLLARLRAATGKPVVLAGDMNITYRAEDAAWTLRRIDLARLSAMTEEAEVLSEEAWRSRVPHLSQSALTRLSQIIVLHLCDSVESWWCSETASSRVGRNSNSSSNHTWAAHTTAAVSVDSSNTGNAATQDGVTNESLAALYSRIIAAQQSNASSALRLSTDVGHRASETDTTTTTTTVATVVASQEEDASYSRGSKCVSSAVQTVSRVSLRELCDAGLRTVHVDDLLRKVSHADMTNFYALVKYCGLPPHGDCSSTFVKEELLMYSTLQNGVQEMARKDVCLPERDVYASESVSCAHSECSHDIGREIRTDSMTPLWDSFLVTAAMTHAAAQQDSGALRVAFAQATHEALHCMRHRCPCPYTCWDQSRNRRQSNEGTRIDYILIDTELLPYVAPLAATRNNLLADDPASATHSECVRSIAATSTDARVHNGAANEATANVYCATKLPPVVSAGQTECGVLHSPPCCSAENFFDELHGMSRTRGLARATARGIYPAAPYTGVGMPTLVSHAKDLVFDGLPSTGLFVTPPQFSDHIGVCLLLRSHPVAPKRNNENTMNTSSNDDHDVTSDTLGKELILKQRKGNVVELGGVPCMYKPPATLHSFFSKARTISTNSDTTCSSVAEDVLSMVPTQHNLSNPAGVKRGFMSTFHAASSKHGRARKK